MAAICAIDARAIKRGGMMPGSKASSGKPSLRAAGTDRGRVILRPDKQYPPIKPQPRSAPTVRRSPRVALSFAQVLQVSIPRPLTFAALGVVLTSLAGIEIRALYLIAGPDEFWSNLVVPSAIAVVFRIRSVQFVFRKLNNFRVDFLQLECGNGGS
jgi:hypothetical protein